MSVLILGATSRIGQALAHEYARAGQPIYLAARDVTEAERIAADVHVRQQVKTAFGRFDALAYDEHPAFVQAVEDEVGPIHVAVVAFGEMGAQATSEQDFEAARKVLEINYTGAASICEALAAVMEPRGDGAIVGITSVAGDRGRGSNYFYGSAKGGFTLYLQGLRNRLFPRVHVMTVKLGFVDTRMTWGMETAIPMASPEAAAKAIRRAQRHRRAAIYHPPFWRPIMGVIKAIPENLFKRLSL